MEDKKNSIYEKVKEAFLKKHERELEQAEELQKYLKDAERGRLSQGEAINDLWKKLAQELESGVSIDHLKGETKYRIFYHYQYLLMEAARKYETNLYLTTLELIRAGEEELWRMIAGFGYRVINEFLPKGVPFSEADFLNKAGDFLGEFGIEVSLAYERQKILGYEGTSYFIYRDKAGRVVDIHFCDNKEGMHRYGEFIGTDEEKQQFADEYERKCKEFIEAEKEFIELAKQNKFR